MARHHLHLCLACPPCGSCMSQGFIHGAEPWGQRWLTWLGSHTVLHKGSGSNARQKEGSFLNGGTLLGVSPLSVSFSLYVVHPLFGKDGVCVCGGGVSRCMESHRKKVQWQREMTEPYPTGFRESMAGCLCSTHPLSLSARLCEDKPDSRPGWVR